MARFGIVSFGIIVFFLCAPAYAVIPSFGLQTAQGIREKLEDKDFLINYNKAAQTKTNYFLAQAASANTFPVLGGQDVQAATNRIFLKYRAFFPTHTHPRATETLYLQKGALRTKLKFEGLSKPRVVSLKVRHSEVTIFPQGLAHSIQCLSRSGCLYITFFNSADPGITGAPNF